MSGLGGRCPQLNAADNPKRKTHDRPAKPRFWENLPAGSQNRLQNNYSHRFSSTPTQSDTSQQFKSLNIRNCCVPALHQTMARHTLHEPNAFAASSKKGFRRRKRDSCRCSYTNPCPQRTHILRLLGPKTLLYKAFELF